MVSDNSSKQLPPTHIAFIMDGNRRWAKANKLSVQDGHRQGFERFKEIVQACFDQGIKYVTVYAFSTENWKRAEEEVGSLMGLMTYAIKSELDAYRGKDIKVNFLGRLSDLPTSLQNEMKTIEHYTEDKNGCVLNVALSYGGKEEIVNAVNTVIQNGKTKITENDIANHLYTAGQPDPDLIVRTGGNPRLSNFLMWQSSYSEIYLTDVLWPDFDSTELKNALKFYSEIQRNFGK